MRNMGVVDGVCHSAFGCGGIGVTTIALVLLTVALALLVLAAIVHVHEASSVVAEERKRLLNERDAFDAFARRISGLEVSEVPAAVHATGGIATATSIGADDRLDQVQDAYRDTVMSVAHYDSDYGEPLPENIAAEFGEGLAVAVVEGRRFTPQLKAALLASSEEASRSRAAFLSTLEDEAQALSDARETMETIDAERESIAAAPLTSRSFEALVDDWNRLGVLSEQCRTMLRDRQEVIRSRSAERLSSAPDLNDYLYDDLPVSYPVLSDLTSLSESIDSFRSRVLDSLTRRV